jgi:flagellar protein FlbD
MFKLTKFTGEDFWVNPEVIKTVEAGGDTVITFLSGERVLVRETAEEIREQFIRYKRAIFTQGPLQTMGRLTDAEMTIA